MPKRLNYELVDLFFRKNGYFLISGTYENCHSRLEFSDFQGYKYCGNYEYFQTCMRMNSHPRKFFYGNLYTNENIELFIKLKSLPYHLVSGQNIKDTKQPILCKCHICPEDEIPFSTTLNNIQHEYGCPLCRGLQIGKYNNLEYKFPKVASEWDYSRNKDNPSDYASKSGYPVYWICPNGHSYFVPIAWRTQGGTGCDNCGGSKLKEYSFISKSFSDNGFTLLSEEYSGCSQKLEYIDDAGYKYQSDYKCFQVCVLKRKQRIKPFSLHNPHSLENIILYTKLNNSQFEILGGKYCNAQEYTIWCRCSICKTEYFTSWRRIKQKTCPYCSESKGERELQLFLTSKNIVFYPQHIFDDCRNFKPLPFDVYLPDYNVVIEYDGIIHFEDKFDSPEEFEKVKVRDEIKTQYCINNNVRLIRIPYTKLKKMKEILTHELNL